MLEKRLRQMAVEAGLDYDSYDTVREFALALGARHAARDARRIAIAVSLKRRAS